MKKLSEMSLEELRAEKMRLIELNEKKQARDMMGVRVALIIWFIYLYFTSCNAQTSLTILNKKSDTVNAGDSSWVQATWNRGQQNPSDTIRLSLQNLLSGVHYDIYKTFIVYFENIPVTNFNGQPVRKIPIQIPSVCKQGWWKLIPEWGTWDSVYVQNTTAVQEYSHPKGEIIRSEMFDMIGQKITYPNGLYFRINYYSEGGIETKKYYYLR